MARPQDLEVGDTVRHPGTYPGIALTYLGLAERREFDPWDPGQETVTIDHDTAVIRMVGDDRRMEVPIEELEALPDDGYCRDCGQIGCTSNVYE